MSARRRRRYLLLSTSVAALFVGGGAPGAYAASCLTVNGASVPSVSNSSAITCIDIENSTVSGNVTNTGTGAITATGATPPTRTGITVNGSTIGGAISNAGTITAASSGNGILVTDAKVLGGITNSGTISANSGVGVFVGGLASTASIAVSTFSGGISNSGTISGRLHGIMVGGTAASGNSVTISTFTGGISNSGTIAHATANGIIVGGKATFGGHVSILSFSGGITNSGAITAGHGIVVGGVAVGAGAAVTISSFSGGITNSGAITARTGSGILVGGLAIGRSASAVVSTFVGGILNTGTINSRSSGIHVGGSATRFAVAGVSSFAGGISNAGTIIAGLTGIQVSGVSVFSSGITNSGSINASFTGISVSNVSTFSGNIANRGTITAGSVGIFVCNCATFAGGSIVNTGSITAATGILVHNSAPVNIFNSGNIVGSGGTAVDLTAASGGNTFTLGPGYSITGNVLAFAGGNDTFQLGGMGSGSFDLSSVGPAQQYENFANFNVVSGTWTVFNTFGQSQAWNVDGGILAGTGTLAALNVNNGGTLAPGNIGVPGTFMTVTGDLTFQPGAIYLVQLDPTAASRVNVGGAVSLAGAVDGFLSPGSYGGKTTYDILDPTSITGTFTGFTALNAPGFTGTLTYTPTEVLLNLVAQLGNGGGLNVNQQNVANGINTFFNNGGTLPANFFPFFTLTSANLANVLTPLDGEDAADAHFGAFQLMNQFLNLMLDPWVDGRHGGGSGTFGFAPDQEASFPPDVALAFAGVLKAPPKPTFDQRWTVWGSAFGGTSKIDGDPVIGSANVTAGDYGFAAGMDYRASPDTIVGFALAGGGTSWGVAQGLGTGRSDAFMAGAYGTTYWGPAYLAGAVAFANHWLTTNRVALSDQLTANFTGQDFAGRVEAGYRYAVPIGGAEIGIAPYGALQTQWFRTPTYSETDLSGGGFGLTYSAATVNDTRSELGARFDDLITMQDKPLLLRGRLAWAHDWISGAAQTAAFQALPGSSFSVSGAAGPTDSALTTAMAEWHFRPRWSLTGKFDGEFARGAQTYAGTGMLRYSW